MKRRWIAAGWTLGAAALGIALAAAADFEVAGPDGRRILLKDDGTWRYVDDADKGGDKAASKGKTPGKSAEKPPEKSAEKPPEKSAEKPTEKPKVAGEAVLRLERRQELGGSCRFDLQLTNGFPHVIQSFVPTFAAIRADGVTYDSQNAGFLALRPGDSQTREILFRGIACQDVVRLQVSGGDRCVVGDLDRFSPADGECLKRVRVVASELVRFDK